MASLEAEAESLKTQSSGVHQDHQAARQEAARLAGLVASLQTEKATTDRALADMRAQAGGAIPAAAAKSAAGTGRFDAALERASAAYVEGEFSTALEQLEALRPEVEGSQDRAAQKLLLEQLVYLQVAFDRPEEACDSYSRLLVMEPSLTFDPDQVSPKIRRVVERCGV